MFRLLLPLEIFACYIRPEFNICKVSFKCVSECISGERISLDAKLQNMNHTDLNIFDALIILI